MDDTIIVRPATADDLPAIGRLNREAVPAVGDVDEAALWRLVQESSATFVAVERGSEPEVERGSEPDEDEGEVVGFLLAFGPGADYASPNYRFFADRYVAFQYVDRVVVDPMWARRGIGARLYDAVEDLAVSTDSPVVTAEVNVAPPNPASLAFHAARGFVGVGEQDTEDGAKRVRLLVRELR